MFGTYIKISGDLEHFKIRPQSMPEIFRKVWHFLQTECKVLFAKGISDGRSTRYGPYSGELEVNSVKCLTVHGTLQYKDDNPLCLNLVHPRCTGQLVS